MNYLEGTYTWKRTNKATTDIAAPNITIMIMAVKILGAAEGFRPKALILAYPVAAMIRQGPKIAKMNIRTMAAWSLMPIF